jgi:phosphoribosylglycinamide formyltransferase 1
MASLKPSLRLTVLISGSGTTLQNLIDRTRAAELPATIVGIVASRVGIFGIERAAQAQLPVCVVERKPTATFSERVFTAIRASEPDFVVLAGWLHLLQIPADFENRVLNIHPSLLPAFGGAGMYGRHVHEAVLASGATVSGCTVHFADNSYDTGPIVLQRQVPVLKSDTPDSLAARVQTAECEAYPEAIRKIAGMKSQIG